MENAFTMLDPNACLAVLSAFVFQEKTEVVMEEMLLRLPESLRTSLDTAVALATSIADIQRQHGLDVSVDEFLKSTLNFGLAEVVYEWGRGTEFKDITELTDVLEGSIVRTITRLDETCREIRDAARVIGNDALYSKMEESSAAIKRDIVFAASLYV